MKVAAVHRMMKNTIIMQLMLPNKTSSRACGYCRGHFLCESCLQVKNCHGAIVVPTRQSASPNSRCPNVCWNNRHARLHQSGWEALKTGTSDKNARSGKQSPPDGTSFQHQNHTSTATVGTETYLLMPKISIDAATPAIPPPRWPDQPSR